MGELLLTSPPGSRKYLILLEGSFETKKLCAVEFVRKQGVLEYMVYLPYFHSTLGILVATRHEGEVGSSYDVDMEEAGGKTVSHLVKYSHHADGRAHFSQDTKILTSVVSHTAPLSSYQGHCFTLQFWGANGFKSATPSDSIPSNKQRPAILTAPGGTNDECTSGRIVCRVWQGSSLSSAAALTSQGWARPVRWTINDRYLGQGVILLPRDRRPQDFFLSVDFKPLESDTRPTKPSMVFLGGFRDENRLSDVRTSPDYIAAFYTNRDQGWPELVKKLGSLDLERDQHGKIALG